MQDLALLPRSPHVRLHMSGHANWNSLLLNVRKNATEWMCHSMDISSLRTSCLWLKVWACRAVWINLQTSTCIDTLAGVVLGMRCGTMSKFLKSQQFHCRSRVMHWSFDNKRWRVVMPSCLWLVPRRSVKLRQVRHIKSKDCVPACIHASLQDI